MGYALLAARYWFHVIGFTLLVLRYWLKRSGFVPLRAGGSLQNLAPACVDVAT